MANRNSASEQAAGGASRSPNLNPQPANRNRSTNTAGKTSSKPQISSNKSSGSKTRTRKSSAALKQPPQVAANHSLNRTKSQDTSNKALKSQGMNSLSWIFSRAEATSRHVHKASQDRSMYHAASAQCTRNGLNNIPRKFQGHAPVPQPNVSLKLETLKARYSQPFTRGHSTAPNSILFSPSRPGNPRPSLFSGVHENKAGQRVFQDQSSTRKAHSHITQELSNKSHKNNLPKPAMSNRSLGQIYAPPAKNVTPSTAKASLPISDGSKGTKNRSSNLMNHSGSKRNSSSGSHQANMSAKQSPAATKDLGPLDRLASWLPSTGSALFQATTRTKPMSSPSKVKLLVASSRAADHIQKSSKHRSVRGSSMVKSTKPTFLPRRKEFQVLSNSSKGLSRPPTKTITLHKALLRQHSPTLIWKMSESPNVISAYSTVTAAPLPPPPNNKLQNKVARRTIAQNPDLFKVVSPIKADAFKKYLKDHPNQPFVKSVVYALKNGFWSWADANNPALPTTYDGSRQRQPITNKHKANFIRQQRDEEIELKRWSKPFGGKLLPGMHASPIAAIPKSTPGKYRLIIDQSCGPHALNSIIPKSQVKVKLDTVHDLGTALLAVRKKHPKRKLCLFKSDVKSAYRQLPMHPLWQIKQVVSIDGQCHVDRCNTFGNRGGGWNWYAFASLVNWIGTEKKKIPDLLGYVDDNFGWEFEGNTKYYKPYKKHLPANQTRLLKLWDELGIPHDEDKQLSGPSLPILGYEVDANAMTIKVPDEKKTRVIKLLRNYAREGKSYTLKELQSVAGTANDVLSLYPYLRPGLRGLFNEMAGKKGPGTKLMVTNPVACSLSKLADYLGHAQPVPIQQKKQTVRGLRARMR